MGAEIVIKDPKINIKSHAEGGCKCVSLETVTSNEDIILMHFDNLDAIKAYHGLLGYALDLAK